MKTKFLSLMLAGAMVLGASFSVCAQEEAVDISAQEGVLAIKEQDKLQIAYDSVTGPITKIEDGRIYLNSGDDEVILNIPEDAEYLTVELNPIAFEDIKTEMYVMAIIKPFMTLSLPPQCVATTIIVSENAELPVYAEIASCETDDNGTVVVNSADDRYIFEVNNESVVNPYKTRNILTKEDLTTGDRILVYADKFTKSIPAKAYAKKIVVLENNFDRIQNDTENSKSQVKVKETADSIKIYVNDALAQTAHQAFVDENNRTLIAAEDAAFIFGLKLNVNENTIVFDNDQGEALAFEAGKNQCIVEGDMILDMDTVPQAKDGTLYVPLRYLAQNMGCEINYEQ